MRLDGIPIHVDAALGENEIVYGLGYMVAHPIMAVRLAHPDDPITQLQLILQYRIRVAMVRFDIDQLYPRRLETPPEPPDRDPIEAATLADVTGYLELNDGPLAGRIRLRRGEINPSARRITIPMLSDTTGRIFLVTYLVTPEGLVWRSWLRARAERELRADVVKAFNVTDEALG